MSPAAGRLVALLFIVTISLPLAGNVWGFDGADPAIENREMAPFPGLDGSLESVQHYADGFSAWFSDHFAFRARLIEWNAVLKVFVLKTSSSSEVLLGKNGWLFYADDGSIEDLVSAVPLQHEDLRNWHDAIVRARDWTRAKGMAFLFVVAPDKHVIYPDLLPDSVHRLGKETRTDQVFQAFADISETVDLRPAVLAASKSERVYHVTDTHWNERGVFAAYTQIIDALRRQAPDVPAAWDRSEFDAQVRVTPAGDLAGMLGLKRLLEEERLVLVPKRARLARVVQPSGALPTAEEGYLVTEIPGSHLPKAVVFRDSFFSPMVPFFSEHFSRVVYLWQKDFVPESLRGEHPDVVIHEMIGRRLHTFIPTPDLVPN